MDKDVQEQIVMLLPRMRRFAQALSRSHDESEELVQAACERALTRLNQFENGTRLDSWLFRIIRTIWVDRMRCRTRRLTFEHDIVFDSAVFDARIHEQTVARMELETVRATIQQLPVEQSEVLALVIMDGLTYQETAIVLDIPVGTVMSRLSRARRKLAEAIRRPRRNGAIRDH